MNSMSILKSNVNKFVKYSIMKQFEIKAKCNA